MQNILSNNHILSFPLPPILYYTNYFKRFNRLKYLKVTIQKYPNISKLIIFWFLKRKHLSTNFFYDLFLGHYFYNQKKITNYKTLLNLVSKSIKKTKFIYIKQNIFSLNKSLKYIQYFKELFIAKIALKLTSKKPITFLYRRTTFKQNSWWRNFLYIKYFKSGLFHLTKTQLNKIFLIKLFNFKKWIPIYNFETNILHILCFGFLFLNIKLNNYNNINEKIIVIFNKLLGLKDSIYYIKPW